MQVRQPVFLRRLTAPGSEAFAVLYGLESMARALLATVIPLEALRLLGSAQGVSQFFFAVSIFSLLGCLAVPWLIRRSARRAVYTIAFLLLALAPAFLAQATPGLFLLGMILRALAVGAATICLSLYIMQFIGRQDFSRSEPTRLFYSAGAWCFGPFVGVYLGEAVHPLLPYALSAVCAMATLGYFWLLRIREVPAVKSAPVVTPSPLRYVRHFFTQPRLGLAWLISTGRNVWWVIFFIYAPIYAVETGLGKVAGGAIVSLGTAFLFAMPMLGRLARRHGIRWIFVGGFTIAGGCTVGMLVVWDAPIVAAMMLICAAIGMTAVDATGNVLFMLSVRKRERAEMTAVYSTFRDVADILPPATFSVLLKFFELPVVFFVGGATAFGLAFLSTMVHPRLGRPGRGDAMPLSRQQARAGAGLG